MAYLRDPGPGPGRRLGWLMALGVGALAGALVALGNPGNMGLCGACFLRDLAGSLALYSAPGPRIFRPEVFGVMAGALLWRVARGRFEARSGSHAVARLFFGVWMAVGALVFLGCPFRALQRLGGGDLNAAVGLLGLVAGVGAGRWFERRGYSVGRTQPAPAAVGLLGLLGMGVLFVLYLGGGFLAGPGPSGAPQGPAHAPWGAALGLAAAAGVLLSATGFCAVQAAREVFGAPRPMLVGAALLVGGYAGVAAAAGFFHPGFSGQPAAHTDALWNALGLGLVGLAGALAGGCPVRQLVMAGEGNGDAFVTVVGLLVGGALAHTFGLVSTAAGPTAAGQVAVLLGLGLCVGHAALSRARPA